MSGTSFSKNLPQKFSLIEKLSLSFSSSPSAKSSYLRSRGKDFESFAKQQPAQATPFKNNLCISISTFAWDNLFIFPIFLEFSLPAYNMLCFRIRFALAAFFSSSVVLAFFCSCFISSRRDIERNFLCVGINRRVREREAQITIKNSSRKIQKFSTAERKFSPSTLEKRKKLFLRRFIESRRRKLYQFLFHLFGAPVIEVVLSVRPQVEALPPPKVRGDADAEHLGFY